jgi:hypothetical protein
VNQYTKYRPYFTLSELQEIRTCLAIKPGGCNTALIRYLDSFIIKINSGVQEANLSLKIPITEKLELGDSSKAPTILASSRKETAYNKWLANPHLCTSQEIALAMMYRYENDMMDSEEESIYESKHGLGA